MNDETSKKKEIVDQHLKKHSRANLNGLDYACFFAFPIAAFMYWIFG